ncbi:hypothetical protein BCR42DRAFT_442306 [Absidia repens]|uniref:F5/8 type C domain-containing protein n=1 Tax=Absidia repens TaxID=90262 RepID=A0A1X2I2M7_9FUNG|nr:hypothetical protein BCR42DRAFT_442306 [Absidia repens]
MKPTRESYFSHQRRQSTSTSSSSNNAPYPSSPSASSVSSSSSHRNNSNNKLRGIHINISSDPFQHRIPPYLQRLWQESQWKQYASKVHRMGRRYYATHRLKQMIIIGMVVVFCICVVLLLHVGFFSGKKYQDWERQSHRHHYDSGMEEYMDEVDLLEDVYPDAGKGLTTLILVLPPPPPPSSALSPAGGEDDSTTTSVDAILPVLKAFCDHDIFGQVLLWNNYSPHISLDQVLLFDHCPASKITIHNASSDLKSTARYMACTMAKTPYCYFYDPTHPMPQQLRSVYANFLRSPTWVHGASVNRAHYTATQWTWCFWYNDSDVHLHTCYITPDTGMFVTKDMATTFLHQMELDPIDPAFADMYFTLWMNQGPGYILQGKRTTTTSASDVWTLTDDEMAHLQHGLRTLYNSLKYRNGIFSTSSSSLALAHHGGVQGDREQQAKRHARTSCHDDRCLFLTNVASLPNMDLITYQPFSLEDSTNTTTVQDTIRLHQDYYTDHHANQDQKSGSSSSSSHSNAGWMATHTYDRAVDGNDATAWMSPEWDYIGLDLLMPVRIPLKYRILVNHPYPYRRAIQYQMSYDGALWIDLRSPTLHCVSLANHQRQAEGPLLECRFLVPETGYRFLRLVTLHDLDYRYMVYDFSFSAKVKRDKDGRFLDTVRDDGLAFVDN